MRLNFTIDYCKIFILSAFPSISVIFIIFLQAVFNKEISCQRISNLSSKKTFIGFFSGCIMLLSITVMATKFRSPLKDQLRHRRGCGKYVFRCVFYFNICKLNAKYH
ncbi:hypothetical protein ENBRE01_3380, partial [Enteropsectra breve]